MIPQDTGQTKGYTLLSYVEPIRRERTELWQRMEGAMSDDARAFFRGTIFANNWYPRTRTHELLTAFHESVSGEEREFRELGAMSARYQVHVIYRMFLKFATPAFVFRRASSLWQRQSTVGSFDVAEDHDDHLVGILEDPCLPVGVAPLIAGWSDTIVAMLGRTPYPTTFEQVGPTRWRFRVSWIQR